MAKWQKPKVFTKTKMKHLDFFCSFSHVYLQNINKSGACCRLQSSTYWIVLIGLQMFRRRLSLSVAQKGSWKKDPPPYLPFTTFSLNRPPRKEGLRWNTPLGFVQWRFESQLGCWKGSPGCLPVWRASLPGFDTSLFSCRGTWRLLPGRPWGWRSALQWCLQK